MDDVAKLGLLMMLVEAFAESGDRERANEYSVKFQKLHDRLREGGRFAQMGKERNALLQMVNRVKAKAPTDPFVAPDGEQRLGPKLARKLKEAREDEVLEESLPDGSHVYFSKKPDALQSKLDSVDRELAAGIGRDPEFDYYYAVKEAPRDAQGRSGR